MAGSKGSKGPKIIDGFASVQAVRRGTGRKARPPAGKAKAKSTAGKTSEPATTTSQAKKKPVPPSRAKRTALPSRHEIVCYDCGYTFTMPGQMRDTYCPKCRTTIVVSDITIDEEWTGSVKTMGTITLTPSGCLKEANLTAGDMIVEGNAEDGTINVCRTLELRKGARFDPTRVTVNDIRIRQGCRLALKVAVACQTLHVEGQLKGEVRTGKTVTVHPGGMLQGKIHTACLQVEKGGGLKAQLFIGRE